MRYALTVILSLGITLAQSGSIAFAGGSWADAQAAAR